MEPLSSGHFYQQEQTYLGETVVSVETEARKLVEFDCFEFLFSKRLCNRWGQSIY